MFRQNNESTKKNSNQIILVQSREIKNDYSPRINTNRRRDEQNQNKKNLIINNY